MLSSSNALPSIISLSTLPILTRLFPPQAVGEWAIFQSMLFIPSVFATFRYEFAISVEEKEEDADTVATLGIGLSVLSALVAGTLLGISALFDFAPIPEVAWFGLGCLALSFMLCGFLNVGTGISVRNGTFGTILRARVLQSAIAAGVPIALAYWWPSATVLVLGSTLGMLVGAALFAPCIQVSFARFRLVDHSLWRLHHALRRNQAFARFGLPYTIVLQAFGLAVNSILAIVHRAFVLGQFSLMSRAVTAPGSIATTSIGQLTVRPLVNFADNRTAASKPMVDLALLLLALSLPLGTIGTLYGEDIFIFVFGPTWGMAGRFAELAAIPMCLKLSIGWIDRLFDAWREQRLGLYVGVLGGLAWFGSFCLAIASSTEPETAVAGWSFGLALNAIIWGAAMVRLVGIPRGSIRFLALVLVVGIAPFFLANWLMGGHDGYLRVAVLIVVLVAAYAVMFIAARQYGLDLRLLDRSSQ